MGAGLVSTSCHPQPVNGSRTIVDYRELDECSFEAFCDIDFTLFQWLPFEGRNVEQPRRILEYARAAVPGIPRSVELGKNPDGIETLCGLADLLLYSRCYVRQQDYDKLTTLSCRATAVGAACKSRL